MVERITTKQELLDHAIGRYNFFRKIYESEPSEHVSKYYLQDFLKDLLLIQRYANIKEDNESSAERPEGLADVS